MGIAATGLGAWALSYDGHLAVQLLVYVVWLSLLFRGLFAPGVAMWPRMVVGLIAWLLMTALIAHADVVGLERTYNTADIITVDTGKGPVWHYEVSGRLLRLIERGAIIKGKDGRIIYIPKEHVQRIDQNVQLETKPN